MNTWSTVRDDEIDRLIDEWVSKNPKLNPVVGLFFLRMSEVEHQIDRNIAHLLMPVQNYETYYDLTREVMIARKCRMLLDALKEKQLSNAEVGPELKNRVNYFQHYVNAEVRNKLAHSLLAERDGVVYASNSGAMLDEQPIKERPSGRKPPGMRYSELGRIILWLIDFHTDLNTLAAMTWPDNGPPDVFELDAPASSRESSGKKWR